LQVFNISRYSTLVIRVIRVRFSARHSVIILLHVRCTSLSEIKIHKAPLQWSEISGLYTYFIYHHHVLLRHNSS